MVVLQEGVQDAPGSSRLLEKGHVLPLRELKERNSCSRYLLGAEHTHIHAIA